MNALLDQVMTEVGLGVGLGLRNPPLEAAVLRPLTEGDLQVLATTPLGVTAPPLQRIRAVHHEAARLIATGAKCVEVSAITGLSQSRLSILQADPSFGDLVSHYTSQEQARFAEVQQRMVLLGLDAAAELHERVVDSPEGLKTADLVAIMTSAFDRGGFSPVHKSESVSVNMSPQELADIKSTVKSGLRGQVVEQQRSGINESTPGGGRAQTQLQALSAPTGAGAPVGGTQSPGAEEPVPAASEGRSGSREGV